MFRFGLIRRASAAAALHVAASSPSTVDGDAVAVVPEQLDTFGSKDWRLFFNATTVIDADTDASVAAEGPKTTRISPWHDIDLVTSTGAFSFINEIPRGTRAKLEIDPKSEHNPIKQDVFKKTGLLRSFTYGDIPFNYGCLPQTFEDPTVKCKDTGLLGDGDPVDIVELSPEPIAVGAVTPVRIIGGFALIDEGELDWKMLAVPETSQWYSIRDVPAEQIAAVKHWFHFYKTTDGKPENKYAFEGELQGAKKVLDVVGELNEQYESVVARKSPAAEKLWLPAQ